jgi:HD superfamily phosphohydrolase
VRLCNINSLYLTGASEPKRFEHCLGVYHLADVWLRGRGLTERESGVLRAAALLHDLFTGPFGHSFQYVMEDNPFEQRFEHGNLTGGVDSSFYQSARAAGNFAGRPFTADHLLGDKRSEVSAAVSGTGPFGPLIAGTLDLDNLDNVVRLAFHMGLCDDADRAVPLALAPLLEPIDGGLAAPSKAGFLFERWFQIRKKLYEFLLLDRGEFAAKAMLTLAIELAAARGLLGPDIWLRTDDGLLDHLESASIGENQFVGQIVKRLRVGDLFECLEIWKTSEIDKYAQMKDAAAKRELEVSINAAVAQTGGPRLRICIHFIIDDRKTCRSLSFRESDTGERRTVGYDSKSLLVGAFVTNARATPLTAQERQRAIDVVKSELALAGLSALNTVPEPLRETASDGLFGS